MSAISLVDSYLVKVKGGGLPNISLSSWCRLSLDVVNAARLSSWMASPGGTALDADAASLPDTPNRGTPNPLYSVVLHTRGPPRDDPASFSNLVETMVGCPPAFEIVFKDREGTPFPVCVSWAVVDPTLDPSPEALPVSPQDKARFFLSWVSQAWVRGAGRRPEELVLYLPPSQDGSDDAILSAVHIFPVRRAASSSVDRA